MLLREAGAILILMIIVVAVGNLWFHFVESILNKIRNLIFPHREPSTWHLLPPEEDEKGH
ncbi:hypothetical protein B5E43_02415 [Flavonifractor sp. An100]|nr:hypothetical protein B5E43_02415 [Flavonifractor sp. An100]